MIDARGRSCPEPVIMIKKAMTTKESSYEMLVDNRVSVENVTRFASYDKVVLITCNRADESGLLYENIYCYVFFSFWCHTISQNVNAKRRFGKNQACAKRP